MIRTTTIEPSLASVDGKAREGNLVPLSCEMLADLETPISAFLKIRDLPQAFLLESVEGGEKIARYSFLGGRPLLLLTSRDGATTTVTENGQTRVAQTDPLSAAREVLSQFRPVRDPSLPRFTGGLLGYFGYDLVRGWERLPGRPRDEMGIPIVELGLMDTVLIFDHVRHRIRVVANARVDDGVSRGYRDACARIEEMLERLHRGVPAAERRVRARINPSPTPNMTREEFSARVARAKEYIAAGDIFQVILSQRFDAGIGNLDPFDLYRALRAINPSPYMFYLANPGATLVGSSPERLVRLEGDLVEMRPIAGTRPRGATDAEDQALSAEMCGDEKERAEHVMLVDLTRNDVGRIARYGTVRVTELMVVERYSHVMHLVSNVQGRLEPGRDALDVLRAVFPHGTVSGAPKVRAMEIIDELEPVSRGPYAGAVGYVDFSGNLDTAITIRTIVCRDGRASVQAGAGIVADSVPEREYDETVNKARALMRAIEMAGGSLR